MAGVSEDAVSLSNLQVLDCKVCNQPLTIPFLHFVTCRNGHTALKTRSKRFERKCATCGLERDCKCRHLEDTVASVKFPCQNRDYGCKELISYCVTKDHENNCVYEWYPCPKPGCQFRGLSTPPSDNILERKPFYCTQSFEYNRKFILYFWKDRDMCLLREEEWGDVFVVKNDDTKWDGNGISISFVSSSAPVSGKVVDEVKVTAGTNLLKYCGFAPTGRRVSEEYQEPAQLIVSCEYLVFKDSFSINLKLCPVPKLSGGVLVDVDEMEERKVEVLAMKHE